MRALLSTWGLRRDVEPSAGLAVRLRDLGEEVRVCAPPDDEFVALLAGVGVPLVPLGPTVRSVVAGARPSSAEDAFRLAAELVAARHQALFRRVAAVVHPGAAGTTTTAARVGASQVVVPQIADQPYWAARVAEPGIGAAHDGPRPTVESLSAAAARLLLKSRVKARGTSG